MFEHNGKSYARVTSDIIGSMRDSGGKFLVDFSHIDKEILDRKTAIGTNVHNAIHDDIQGNFPLLIGDEQGYFKSFDKWRRALNPTFIETERRYYCDEKMITGCIDGLIKLHGEEKAVLVDFKTSAQESPITWPLQGHLYHYLVNLTRDDLSPRILFIKLDRNGFLPKVFEYKVYSRTMDQCMQAIATFWKDKK